MRPLITNAPLTKLMPCRVILDNHLGPIRTRIYVLASHQWFSISSQNSFPVSICHGNFGNGIWML
ncbi:hypothetical protein SAMN05192589_1184 [Paracidovorax valerianellae]|uniref:Uncharacterized protein n=1 Tax=Paracidovorax valerianellae TaxID=187868 RepID=A0A1G7D220_9BURK|nr:hypothetical protein SAMN05192589_1184 [Paracidovorax valerianellae]